MMTKLFIVSLVFISILNAKEYTTMKTSCIQQSEHAGKTLDQQKQVLIDQAKQLALTDLYGEMIFSSTEISDGKLISDDIRSKAIGSVRIKGNPSFYNGKNFGEVCTDITAYITDKDLEKYSPKKVNLERYCFNDPSVAMKDIKTQAKYGAYKEIISQYKPSLKLTGEQAEKLIHGFKISDDKFDFDTASYCFNAVATILPYELEMGGDTQSSSNAMNAKTEFSSCQDIKDNQADAKSGYYDITINGKKANVHCEMKLDGGGWTRVWASESSNYNTKNYDYNVAYDFIDKSKETFIAYSLNDRIELPYKFETPRAWKYQHPLTFANGTTQVYAIDLYSGRTYQDTLYYGYQNFSNKCSDSFKGSSWGKICIAHTTSPFYTSFAHSESDHCNTARESYNAVDCGNKKFVIYMK